jgi:hypothetical protein
MSIQAFFVRTVVVLRTTPITDRYHNLARDWKNAITVVTTKGWLAPNTSQTENDTDREQAEAQTWLYLAEGIDIQPTDRVTVDGILYQVLGDIADCWTPAGGHHLEVRVKEISG